MGTQKKTELEFSAKFQKIEKKINQIQRKRYHFIEKN